MEFHNSNMEQDYQQTSGGDTKEAFLTYQHMQEADLLQDGMVQELTYPPLILCTCGRHSFDLTWLPSWIMGFWCLKYSCLKYNCGLAHDGCNSGNRRWKGWSVVGLKPSLKMELEMELFYPLAKPQLRFSGAAADARDHQLANIIMLLGGLHHYLVVIELPRIQCCDGEVEWIVNEEGEVTIEGQITPAAIFKDSPLGRKTKWTQLCPTESWVSFDFPGLVDWGTTSVLFTSQSVMEITGMKSTPVAETSSTSAMAGSPALNRRDDCRMLVVVSWR